MDRKALFWRDDSQIWWWLLENAGLPSAWEAGIEVADCGDATSCRLYTSLPGPKT
jgi:hypothetical protein